MNLLLDMGKVRLSVHVSGNKQSQWINEKYNRGQHRSQPLFFNILQRKNFHIVLLGPASPITVQRVTGPPIETQRAWD